MQLPTQFGKYRLLERIAAGGMAEVYRATLHGPAGFEKTLAVKQILPQFAGSDTFTRLFIEEAKITVSLTHGNVVPIYELGRINGIYYIAMEYIHGQNLARVLERGSMRGQSLGPALSVFIAIEVLKGLDYAHRRRDEHGHPLGIVHRDVTPPNVLISYDGEVKLADFGIAKALLGAAQAGDSQPGMIRGKYSYLAPEQVQGKPVDARTDIFAAGIILFEMLTGRRLFRGNGHADTLNRVAAAKVPPPSQIRAEIPAVLDAIVLRALAREPRDRYRDANQLALALSRYLFTVGDGASSQDVAAHIKGLFPEEASGGSSSVYREADSAPPGLGPGEAAGLAGEGSDLEFGQTLEAGPEYPQGRVLEEAIARLSASPGSPPPLPPASPPPLPPASPSPRAPGLPPALPAASPPRLPSDGTEGSPAKSARPVDEAEATEVDEEMGGRLRTHLASTTALVAALPAAVDVERLFATADDTDRSLAPADDTGRSLALGDDTSRSLAPADDFVPLPAVPSGAGQLGAAAGDAALTPYVADDAGLVPATAVALGIPGDMDFAIDPTGIVITSLRARGRTAWLWMLLLVLVGGAALVLLALRGDSLGGTAWAPVRRVQPPQPVSQHGTLAIGSLPEGAAVYLALGRAPATAAHLDIGQRHEIRVEDVGRAAVVRELSRADWQKVSDARPGEERDSHTARIVVSMAAPSAADTAAGAPPAAGAGEQVAAAASAVAGGKERRAPGTPIGLYGSARIETIPPGGFVYLFVGNTPYVHLTDVDIEEEHQLVLLRDGYLPAHLSVRRGDWGRLSSGEEFAFSRKVLLQPLPASAARR